MVEFEWIKPEHIQSHRYTCYFCANQLASDKGWFARIPQTGAQVAFIHICHFCGKPTFLDQDGKQYPGVLFGEPVKNIEDDSVQELYDEARRTMSVSSYTAAVLSCRKLLMHIAVQKGANAGDSFADYVKYLAINHYIPPDAVGWVDHIREKSNEANHEINIMAKNDAETLLSFIAMLLKVIYEFPARIKPLNEPQSKVST